MKYLGLFAAAAVLSSTAVMAAGPGGRGDHFAKMDKNGDGKITSSEMDSAHEDFIRAADANGDGGVTQEEMQAHHKKKMAERLGDTNGDGAISRAEFEAQSAERFKKLDKNGDGSLSQDELRDGRRGGHEGRGKH
ncbi:MAG: EF-hand domain-containing protein [Parvularculaceae bacterium]|nr:EF-hand domain-containing protein [Parvularculaceae bacterium]